MGKAETASRDKNVSGAADCGESRDGGTRAVSFTDPCCIKFRRPLGGAELPLARRPHREARVSRGGASGDAPGAHPARNSADRRREGDQPAFAKREIAVCRKSVVMTRKKKVVNAEFHTVKRIDNSRLVRNVEPAKMRNLFRTVALGSAVAAFFMFYIFQHFRCIDLSFRLEDFKAQEMKAAALNSELKLEIAGLRNPMRIDVIARRRLGLTEPLPTQVQEYEAPDGAEVAAARYVRPNHAP